MSTTKQTISVAPTAATVAQLLDQAGIPAASTTSTNLIARAAVEAGLGDITIDRLGFRLTLDGEPITEAALAHAAKHTEVPSREEDL